MPETFSSILQLGLKSSLSETSPSMSTWEIMLILTYAESRYNWGGDVGLIRSLYT